MSSTKWKYTIMSNAAASNNVRSDYEMDGKIDISSIVRAPHLQPRNKVSEAVVNRYANQMLNGAAFPPVRVHRVKGVLFLVDGFHRLEAAMANGETTIRADIVDSNMDEARTQAALANLQNALQLKPAEYRNVFRMLIGSKDHHNGSKKGRWMTYDEIGKRIGKGKQTVFRWMAEDFPKVAEQMKRVDPMKDTAGELQPMEAMTEQEVLMQTAAGLIKLLQPALTAMEPENRRDMLEQLGVMLREVDAPTLARVVFKAEDEGDF